MLRTILCAALFCLALSGVAQADAKSDSLRIARITASPQVVAQFGLRRDFDENAAPQLDAKLRRSGLNAETRRRIIAIVGDEFEVVAAEKVVLTVAAIFRENFSAAELARIAAFYDSPAGRKFARLTPHFERIGRRKAGEHVNDIIIETMKRAAPRLVELMY